MAALKPRVFMLFAPPYIFPYIGQDFIDSVLEEFLHFANIFSVESADIVLSLLPQILFRLISLY